MAFNNAVLPVCFAGSHLDLDGFHSAVFFETFRTKTPFFINMKANWVCHIPGPFGDRVDLLRGLAVSEI